MSDKSSINMKSDGIELELADGRTVRAVVSDCETEKRLMANAVWVDDKFARYGKDADDATAFLWFEEVNDDE